MDKKRRWYASWSAIVVGAASIALVVIVVFATGVFSPQVPLQVSSTLPACESAEVEQGVADYIAAQTPGTAVQIVSIQEVSRKQGLDGGPIERRDCQVNLRTADGYERVMAELTADGSADGAAWALRLTEAPEPPVAAPMEGMPPPTPLQEQVPASPEPAPMPAPTQGAQQ